MIRVKLRQTGATIEIEESEFDEKLHERLDASSSDEDEDEVDGLADIARVVAEAAGRVVAEQMSTALERAGVGQPDRSRLAAGRPAGSAGRTEYASMRAHYRSLPEDVREFRNPEDDVLIWEWANGMLRKDWATVERVLKQTNGERQLATSPVSAGGAMVPSPLANAIVILRDKRERIGPRSMNFRSEASTIDVPVEATVPSVAGVAENAAITPVAPTFDQVTLTKKKSAFLVNASRELQEDISGAFSLVTILSNQASRKMAVYNDLQCAEDGDGVGTNYTEALAEATIATVAGVTGALTRAKINLLLHGLPSQWRDGGDAVFMANATVVEFISRLEDGAGRPIYLNADSPAAPISDVGNAVGVVERLPLLEVPFAADDLYIGLLSEAFGVLDNGGIRAESTMEGGTAWLNDQVSWRFIQRRDCAVLQADAFRKNVGAITAPV